MGFGIRSPTRQFGISLRPPEGPLRVRVGHSTASNRPRKRKSIRARAMARLFHHLVEAAGHQRFRRTGFMEYVAVPSSFRLRARELDYLGPFLRFLDDEFAEVGR